MGLTRHAKIGLVVALVFILVTTPIGLLSGNNPILSFIGQLLTLPALPVIYALAQFFPPQMGEPGSPWDNMMLSVGILVSAFVWGLVAVCVSRALARQP
jgi:hypothetical protein